MEHERFLINNKHSMYADVAKIFFATKIKWFVYRYAAQTWKSLTFWVIPMDEYSHNSIQGIKSHDIF